MKTTVPAWNYCSLGGAIRVKIDNGRDLQRLGELDEKYWTVLSCPVADLEFDKETLRLIDSDNDGKIRVGEMVGAARWLCSVIKDKDSIFKGESELGLDNIDRSCGQGQRLYDSARQILHNLGKDSDRISVADASDSIAIFKGTLLNGDGVIVPASCDDPEAAAAVTDCMAAIGSAPDRSGEQGVTADMIEAFYAACADYDAWLAMSEAEKDRIFPFGADTAAAYDAVTAVRDKIDDYFTRCRLLAYDKDAAAAVSVPVSAMSDVASCPIAHPRESGLLPLDGINPFWQDAFDSLMKFVSLPKSSKGLDEAGWAGVLARFVPYTQWLGSKKGAQVEGLGAERVRAILKADRKQYLLDLVKKDRALEQESNSIDDVKKLMLLYRDYAKLLNNYLIFSDFYARSDGRRAIFEAGKLYIDQRCCDLCIRVSDMARHADMVKLSGMFLIYCKCTSKLLGKTMDIVAVMTDGDISELRPGKNGVFYDCAGRDWDATVTKVVDNPVSIKQAFWSPYRKFWEFCVGLINKSAADKDAKMMNDMQAKASEAAKSAPAAVTAAGTPAADASRKQPFDIAKFAGIFAALGLALGYIGSFLTKLAAGIAATPWWQLLLAVAVIMLIISGPSCFIAWSKLRRRNLGPVLNANGWAINSKVLVNIVFGAKLTSVAQYPKLRIADPNALKPSSWWKWLIAVLVLALVAAAVLHIVGIVDLGIVWLSF